MRRPPAASENPSGDRARHRLRAFDVTLRAAVAVALALASGGPADAREGEWTLRLEPVHVSVYGHDPHVMTVHRIDLDATPAVDSRTAVNLTTDSDLGYRFQLRHGRGQWRFGVDFFYFVSKQSVADRTAAADGAIDEVVFEVADIGFISTDPGEVLFYGVLEDTELAAWTVDLYGMRTLAGSPDNGVHLQLGLRNGDFDNDYRAVVGFRDVGGRRLDASSNYGRMMGPLVGLAGDFRRGRNHVEGYIGQSVIFGDAELSHRSRDFTGPLSNAFEVEVELPTAFAEERFRAEQEVAIPITELRLRWTYSLGEHIAFGLGTEAAAWWDVPVPPGIEPRVDGDEALHENTIVFFGLTGSVTLTF